MNSFHAYQQEPTSSRRTAMDLRIEVHAMPKATYARRKSVNRLIYHEMQRNLRTLSASDEYVSRYKVWRRIIPRYPMPVSSKIL